MPDIPKNAKSILLARLRRASVRLRHMMQSNRVIAALPAPDARGKGGFAVRWRAALPRALGVVFWLLVWDAVSRSVGQELLLVSPWRAVQALARMLGERSFYETVGYSFGRILLGFLLGMALGIPLAVFAARFELARILIDPVMHTIKATPVASFVILALLWIRSRYLSVFIAFLMVLPIMYTNMRAGIERADPKLLEMASVFRMPIYRRVTAIYLPAVSGQLLAACSLSLGMCWKAGIAAEVIALPDRSIGAALYQAKLFLSTPELFAWTLAIIALSVLFTKCALWLLARLIRRLEGGEGV